MVLSNVPRKDNAPMLCKHCGSTIRWVSDLGWGTPNDSSFEIGFCSSHEGGHELLDAPDWSRAAAERWKVLNDLDTHSASRAELAASGVSARTVFALLPYDFADLVPAIIRLLTEGGFDRVRKSYRFRDTSAFDAQLREHRKAKDADYEAWSASEAKVELQDHFDSVLPAKRRAKLATQCTTALWTACWYMAHKDVLHLPANEQCDQWTVGTIDLMLPDLLGRSALALHP